MSPKPNLLPKFYLLRRARRQRIRNWVAVGAIEAVVLTGVSLFLRLGGQDPIAGMGATIRSTVEQIELMRGAIDSSRVELADLERRMAVASKVSRHPDWSIVLAMLAKRGEGVIRLESCDLMPGVRAPDGGAMGYRLTLVAVCVSQAELTNFVRQLEESGAFSRIKVLETRRATDDAEPRAVRFTLESWLIEGGT